MDTVADSSDAVTSQQIFDLIASLLKHGQDLQSAALLKLLDCLQSGEVHLAIETHLRYSKAI